MGVTINGSGFRMPGLSKVKTDLATITGDGTAESPITLNEAGLNESDKFFVSSEEKENIESIEGQKELLLSQIQELELLKQQKNLLILQIQDLDTKIDNNFMAIEEGTGIYYQPSILMADSIKFNLNKTSTLLAFNGNRNYIIKSKIN